MFAVPGLVDMPSIQTFTGVSPANNQSGFLLTTGKRP